MMSLLISFAIKGTVVLALGAVAAALLRRSSASLRHCVWVATFVALLAVPVLGALGPSWRVAVLPDAVSLHSSAPLASPSGSSSTPSAGRSVAFSPPEALSVREGSIATSPVSIMAWLGGLWGLGVLAVSLLWLRGFVLGCRLVRTSELVTDRVWSDRLQVASQTSGLRQPVRLLRSEALSVPVAWGWGRPTVVLPPQSDAWDAERANVVLLHEMAHLRRRDAWTQVIAQAALALHWPNPFAWLAYRRFLNAREQACDDAVIQVGALPTAYASHLVAVARELLGARQRLASVIPMIGPDELETRVRSILDGRRHRGQVSRWTMGATLALAVAVGGPLAAFQPIASQKQLEPGSASMLTPDAARSASGASGVDEPLGVEPDTARTAAEHHSRQDEIRPQRDDSNIQREDPDVSPSEPALGGLDRQQIQQDFRQVGNDAPPTEADLRKVEQDLRQVQRASLRMADSLATTHDELELTRRDLESARKALGLTLSRMLSDTVRTDTAP